MYWDYHAVAHICILPKPARSICISAAIDQATALDQQARSPVPTLQRHLTKRSSASTPSAKRTQCERSLRRNSPRAQAFLVPRQQIFRTADNSQVLAAAALDRRLNKFPSAARNKAKWFHHHSFAAPAPVNPCHHSLARSLPPPLPYRARRAACPHKSANHASA
jgi:hypothetical protein